jgi:hypothetical protein
MERKELMRRKRQLSFIYMRKAKDRSNSDLMFEHNPVPESPAGVRCYDRLSSAEGLQMIKTIDGDTWSK